MALISCYECGGKLSTEAFVCPHCGAPPKLEGHVESHVDVNVQSEITLSEPNAAWFNRFSPLTRVIAGAILAAASIVGATTAVLAVFAVLTRHQEKHEIFINRAGVSISCSLGSNCARDAERKGFVKQSSAVAGISLDWNRKPLRIVDVKGTATEAGVRKGDILIELDGIQIAEPFTISRIMSAKRPGDKLTVKVSRNDRQLYFAYNVMPKEEPQVRSERVYSPVHAPKQSLPIISTHSDAAVTDSKDAIQNTPAREQANEQATKVSPEQVQLKQLFDLKAVANQSPETVQQILGEPSELRANTFSALTGKNYRIQEGKYRGGTVDIAYIENGARYITIYLSACAEYKNLDERTQKCVKEKHTGYGWYLYPKGAWQLLGDLGLDKNATADFSNQFTTRWRNESGIYEINVLPTAGNKIWYVHVLTNRVYE